MILDAHTHVPPESQWPLFLEQCDANGVGLAVTSSLGSWTHWPEAGDVRAANEEAARFSVFSAGRVTWLVYVNPHLPDWREELTRGRAAGACGVKLWVCLRDRETGSLARVEEVLEEAAAMGWPVLLHTFDRTDGNLPGELDIGAFAELARRVPAARMIAAHAGGNWRQTLGLLRDLPNTWVDVSGGFPEAGMVEALAADLGARRVLYGSDGLGRSMPSQLAKVLLAEIDEEERGWILGGNAARLLGLDPAALPVPARPAAQKPLPLPSLAEDHFCFCGAGALEPARVLDARGLDAALAAEGVPCAFVADAAGILARNLIAANRGFAEACAGCRRIQVLAALLPTAPNAGAVLDEAAERCAGGILYPALHGWRLDDPRLVPFWERCARRGFPLWINVALGDARFRHPGLVMREVEAGELLAFIRDAFRGPCVIQGASPAVLQACLEATPGEARVRFELSRLTDGTTALPEIVSRFGADRLVMGSEYPLRDLRAVRFSAQRLAGQRDSAAPA